jgi:hypothetical protein
LLLKILYFELLFFKFYKIKFKNFFENKKIAKKNYLKEINFEKLKKKIIKIQKFMKIVLKNFFKEF